MRKAVLLRSLLIAALIVAATALLVALDPALYAAYRGAAPDSRTLDALADAVRHVLDLPVVLVGIALYALLVPGARWRRSGVLFGAMLTQGLLVSVLKKVFGRLRPQDLPDRVAFFGPQWHDAHFSFPGGHAAGAFALAAILSAWYPRWRWVFYGAAVLLTWTRVQLGKHFIGDCFIGAWLGYWVAQCFLVYGGERTKDEEGERSEAHLA